MKRILLFMILLVMIAVLWFAWTQWSIRSTGPIAWKASGAWIEKDPGVWSYQSNTWDAEVIGPITASIEKFDNFLRAKVDTYFRVMYVPYSGFISQKTECDSKYKSLDVNIDHPELKFVGYRLFAGGRRQIGACTPENIAFRVYLGRLHCVRENAYYELRLFEPASSPEDSFKNLLKQTACN